MKTLQSLIAVSLLTVSAASSAALVNPPSTIQSGPSNMIETTEIVIDEFDPSIFDEFDIDGQYPTNPLIHLVHDVVYGHHPLVNTNPDVSPVPLPAAVWLFGVGLIGLVGVARRKA